MRLFIAINFNDETRTRLLTLRNELRLRSERGNFTAPGNLHLTLVFLGECNERQATSAREALDGLVFEHFDVRIDRVGRFRRSGGDIWWAGVQDNTVLSNLYHTLSSALAAEGFAVEKREYSPHITLGREVVADCLPWRIEPFGETIHSVDLMRSERIQGKLIYTPIYRRESKG